MNRYPHDRLSTKLFGKYIPSTSLETGILTLTHVRSVVIILLLDILQTASAMWSAWAHVIGHWGDVRELIYPPKVAIVAPILSAVGEWFVNMNEWEDRTRFFGNMTMCSGSTGTGFLCSVSYLSDPEVLSDDLDHCTGVYGRLEIVECYE